MEKIDFKKSYKQLYQPSGKDFSLIEVPPLTYLMVDGHGNPNTETSHAEAVQALYAVSYTLKFMSKKDPGQDYTVAPLEGLWWASDMDDFTAGKKDNWDWTMMILQPGWFSAEVVNAAIEAAGKKKALPALPLLRLERLEEGLCAQIMHIGSYDDEAPTLHRLHHSFMPDNGLTWNGKHHEVYLSDPRKTEAAKLKTVLRQPVRRI